MVCALVPPGPGFAIPSGILAPTESLYLCIVNEGLVTLAALLVTGLFLVLGIQAFFLLTGVIASPSVVLIEPTTSGRKCRDSGWITGTARVGNSKSSAFWKLWNVVEAVGVKHQAHLNKTKHPL